MRTKYKLEQILKTPERTGEVTAITVTREETTYLLDDNHTAREADVVAVYRQVTTRSKSPKTTARNVKSSSKSRTVEARADA